MGRPLGALLVVLLAELLGALVVLLAELLGLLLIELLLTALLLLIELLLELLLAARVAGAKSNTATKTMATKHAILFTSFHLLSRIYFAPS